MARAPPRRWREIQTNHAAKVEETIINEARETAIRAAELQRETLSLELERAKNKELKDAGASARNASTVKGINIDKVLGLSGRPRVVEHRQAEDIIASLRRLAPKVFVNGDAEEIRSLPELPDAAAVASNGHHPEGEDNRGDFLKALAIIHSEGMVDGFPEDRIHEAQTFGAYCATVGLVLGLDHSRRMAIP